MTQATKQFLGRLNILSLICGRPNTRSQNSGGHKKSNSDASELQEAGL